MEKVENGKELSTGGRKRQRAKSRLSFITEEEEEEEEEEKVAVICGRTLYTWLYSILNSYKYIYNATLLFRTVTSLNTMSMVHTNMSQQMITVGLWHSYQLLYTTSIYTPCALLVSSAASLCHSTL